MKTLIFAALVLSLVSAAVGQDGPMVASVVHRQLTIKSAVLGEERTILVRVPVSYERTKGKFPVVYMLDAHAPQNSMMAGIMEQQAWGGVIPEMILVGIQNTDRDRDLTPTPEAGRGGGGEKFLRFIETQVIPLVEKNYRTQPFRIFAGHSLGGLFVVYTLVTRPDLFNAYIAASPVLGWNNNFVIKRAEAAFKQESDSRITLFAALGNEPDYLPAFNTFSDLLKKAKPKNIDFEFQQLKDENHGSVVLRAYYGGLRKVFDGWIPSATGSVAELETHYRKLSKRFGYEIPVPENLTNTVAYQLLRAGNTAGAIELFRKNTAAFPDSANAHDSLA